MLTEITDPDFEQSVSSGLSIVLFYKDQCPFCKAMKKILDKFSGMPAAAGKDIRLYQINRETNPNSTQSMNVERIPSVIVFRDGQEVGAKSGDLTYKELEKMVA